MSIYWRDVEMSFRIKSKGIIDCIIVGFMLFYYLLPSAYNMVSTWLVLGIVIIYTFYIMMISNRRMVAQIIGVATLIFFISLLYVILTTSTSSLSIIERFVTKLSQWSKMFFPILMYYRFTKLDSKTAKVILLLFAAILISVVVWNSFMELAENPYAARLWNNFDEVKDNNAVTYEYVYAISALIPSLFWCVLRAKKVYIKLILISSMVILFDLLVVAQYTLSIILAVICCLVCFYLKHRNVYLLVLGIFAGVIVIIVLPNLLLWLSTKFESDTISIRFYELAQFLKGNQISSNGDLADRISIYKNCFIYFFRSPLWGNVSVPFNTHSTFLGVLCDLGILGTVPVYYLAFSMSKRVYAIDKSEELKNGFIPVYLVWLLLGFLNPVHAALPLNMVVWFLVPAVSHMLTENSEKASKLSQKRPFET